ncbi:MAG: hypothetical protein ACRCXZ_09500 [Patescibacteria group bacterium]
MIKPIEKTTLEFNSSVCAYPGGEYAYFEDGKLVMCSCNPVAKDELSKLKGSKPQGSKVGSMDKSGTPKEIWNVPSLGFVLVVNDSVVTVITGSGDECDGPDGHTEDIENPLDLT